jgi:hypothetical protein
MKKILIGLLVSLLIIIVVVGAFCFFAIYLPYRDIRAKGQLVVASMQQMKADLNTKNIDVIEARMNDIDKKYTDFEKAAARVYWMSGVAYVSDFKNGVEAGRYSINAGKKGIDAIKPYADIIGLKEKDKDAVPQSADDKLATAVVTLDKLVNKIDPIASDIEEADKRIQKIDPNRYPEKFGKYEVRSNIIRAKEQFDGIKTLFVDAKPLFKHIPDMLGADKPKTYLIIYNNEMEQRPGMAGGFLTYYAVFKVNKGRMTVESSKDMYFLDDSIAVHPPAPRLITTYHINVPKFNIRDSNLSPDFVESMKLFNSLYEKSGEKVKYDGVIAVNSKLLLSLLTIYGDTQADGINFSAKIDPTCDCPDVIYKLFYLVDKPTPYLRENRKAILGDLMQELVRKVFGRGTLLGTFTQSMFEDLNEADIALYFTDPELQQSVEKLNFGGRIRSYDGDYLNVNNANFAGAKSNLYVQKTITSTTTTKGGNIQRTVTITYRNPKPGSDCNLERGNLCLNAKLRNLIRVYVPQGSQLVDVKGAIIKDPKYKQYDELGKTVFEAYIEVLPQGKAEATFTYTLPTSISAQNYKLLIQKQAGEDKVTLNVNVDGVKKKDAVPLTTDLEVK